jgi:hypothetical protein
MIRRLQVRALGEVSMRAKPIRFDAPFWAALLALVILVGSFGCIGLAAAAQGAAAGDAALVIVEDS